jgi:O-antigen ligase
VDQTANEATQWRPGVATDTSVGIRLEFYRNTFEIVKRHPLLGVGTGGFFKAYEAQVQGTQMLATRNPHNMYLLVLVQFGLLGLAALACLFVAQWRYAPHLQNRSDIVLAYALVVTIALSGLFNSMLIDHTESMFLAWMAGLLYGGLNGEGRAA